MFEAFRTAFVTPMVKRWLRTSGASWQTLPVPSGPPVVHAAGPDPDRILLVGAGISMGYGMTSHDVALAGQIARQVSEITMRGVRVDIVVGEDLTVEAARKNLSTRRLRELDVIIATPGTLDKLLLLPVAAWRKRIEYLLEHFSTHAPASLRVLFVAVPEVSKIVRMPRLLGLLADRSARSLNRALEASCAARPYAEFVEFRPTERAGRNGTGRTYEQWAGLIAPTAARALDEHHKVSV
jgi:hypothetical protein